MIGYFIHQSTIIDKNVVIGDNVKIWCFTHILENTTIGKNTSIGQNCSIGPNVYISKNCKIQNNVSLYEGLVIEEEVFIGPSVVFTNVSNPRAFIKQNYKQTLLKRGCTLGANSTIVCGITLGEYCFIGAGSVVIKNVEPYSMVVGNPARHIGYVCKCGNRLNSNNFCYSCKEYFKRENYDKY